MKDAYGYIRVSSEEQADSGLGLAAQRQRITAYCEMKGLRLVEVFEDAAVSGGKPLAKRPAGAQLLSAARKSKAAVVAAKMDRFFRSAADAANTIAAFDRKGIELVAIAEGFDMTNPYGRAMAQMASVFAELERSMIRERTKAAMGVKRARGERISHHCPFGWEFTPDGRLVENPQEQVIIRLMKELRTAGLSFRAIAARLDAEGVAPKRGAKWVHTSVQGILERKAA